MKPVAHTELSYALAKSERTNEDGITYTACGISYHGNEILDDVSSDANLVGKMVELFNLCDLPPDRLKGAVIALVP